VHEDKPTYDVVVEDGETVTATSEHPFMVEGKGYVPVDQLEKGDLLVRSDGMTVEVLSVNATGKTATVHNFEVEELHNYYVRAGGHWLLVHNVCNVPKLVTAEDGSVIDRSSISTRISYQRQGRHVLGHRLYRQGNSYFHSHAEAQHVLDSFHNGTATVVGRKGDDIVVRMPHNTGFNNNTGAGFIDQPTNIHFIKGRNSVSVVPHDPTYRP
jgi:intein/homing endonuclease